MRHVCLHAAIGDCPDPCKPYCTADTPRMSIFTGVSSAVQAAHGEVATPISDEIAKGEAALDEVEVRLKNGFNAAVAASSSPEARAELTALGTSLYGDIMAVLGKSG